MLSIMSPERNKYFFCKINKHQISGNIFCDKELSHGSDNKYFFYRNNEIIVSENCVWLKGKITWVNDGVRIMNEWRKRKRQMYTAKVNRWDSIFHCCNPPRYHALLDLIIHKEKTTKISSACNNKTQKWPRYQHKFYWRVERSCINSKRPMSLLFSLCKRPFICLNFLL